MELAPQGRGHGTKPAPEFKECLDHALRHMVGLLECPEKGQKLDLMILLGLFQLSIHSDRSVAGPSLQGWPFPWTHIPATCSQHLRLQNAQLEEGGCIPNPRKSAFLRDSVGPALLRVPHISTGSS